MAAKTRGNLQADLATLLPDNTTQAIRASSLRTALGNVADTIFREPAYLLEDGIGRILLEGGSGYLITDAGLPFSPDDIPDLVSWLDAGDTSTMQTPGGSPISGTDGDSFLRWLDTKAPGAIPAYYEEDGGAADFIYMTSANGYPAVRGLTGTYPARNSGGVEISAVSQDAQTIFSVVSVNASSTNALMVACSTADSTNTGGMVTFFDTRTQRRAALAITNLNNQLYANIDARDQTTAPRIVAARMTGSGGALDAWRDGALTADSPQSLSGGVYYSAPSRTSILSAKGFLGSAPNTYLHENLVYNRALTNSEVAQVNDYLAAKFGL